jgi:integrase
MASYTKVGDNKYKIFVELGYNDKGRRLRKTKTVTAKSDRALKKLMTEFEIEVHNKQTAFDVENITFQNFVKRWFKMYVDVELSVKTAENYRYWTNHFMMDQLGDLKINKIKTFHIVEYFNTERKAGRGSLRQKYVALKSIFSKAVKWDIIKENPMHGVDKPVPNSKRRDGKLFCYDEEQLKLLLKSLESEKKRFQMQVKLACLVGLRRSEISGIRINNLNFNENTIFIDKTLLWDQKKKQYLLGATKNKKSRTVYVPAKFMKELKQYVNEQRKFKLSCGEAWKGFNFEGEEIELLFTTLQGSPLRSEFFNQEWYKFLKRNSHLPQLNIHGLRHTYASILVNRNENFKVIQEQMGHDNINETIKTYSHLTKERKAQSASIFEEIL